MINSLNRMYWDGILNEEWGPGLSNIVSQYQLVLDTLKEMDRIQDATYDQYTDNTQD